MPMQPQCRAHSRNGERCKNPPMLGGFVCRMHGGKTPSVEKKARERLLEAASPAAAYLARLVTDPKASAADKLRAATAILDRSGHGTGTSVEILDKGGIMEKLRAGRERVAAASVPADKANGHD